MDKENANDSALQMSLNPYHDKQHVEAIFHRVGELGLPGQTLVKAFNEDFDELGQSVLCVRILDNQINIFENFIAARSLLNLSEEHIAEIALAPNLKGVPAAILAKKAGNDDAVEEYINAVEPIKNYPKIKQLLEDLKKN